MMHNVKWARGSVVLLLVAGLAACDSAPQKAARYLERGKALYQAGDYQKARLELKNALQINPKDVDALFLLARDQEKLNNWRQAASGYQRVIELSPRHAQAELRLARIYLLANLPDRAAKLVDQAAKTRPEDPVVYTLRGALAAKRGDVAAAEKDAKVALQHDPNELDATMLLASLYVKTAKYQDATALLNGGIHAHPDDIALHLALADVFEHEKNTAGTVAQLQEVVRLAPKDMAQRLRLASYYDHLGKAKEAQQVLVQAVRDNADSDEAKLALVNFIAGHQGRQDAERKLQDYIQRLPNDYALRFGLAALYLGDGHGDKAQVIYRTVIDQDGTDAKGLEARTLLARLLMKDRRLVQAKALLGEVLKENATDNEALTLRAMIALGEKDPQTAVDALRTVQHDQPESIRVAELLAQAYLMDGNRALAEDQLQRAVKLRPGDPQLRLQLARLLAANKDDRDAAVEQLQAVLKSAPNNPGALNALFDIRMADKEWPAAVNVAKRIMRAFPGKAQGPYMLGMALEGENQFRDSVAAFQASLDNDPRAVQPLSALVKAYVARKQRAEAVKVIDKVLERAPDNPVAYNLRGEVLMLDKHVKPAMQAFNKAIAIQPKWVIPYRNLAAAYLSQRQVKGAVQTYQRGIAATGSAQDLVFDLAALYESQGNHDAAMDEYAKALDKDPSSIAAANNLAMMLVTYRKDHASLDKAKALAKRLEGSTSPAYLDTLGWVLYKSGELDPAVATLQNAVNKAPDSGLLRYHLGMALYRAGKTDAARDNLKIALKGNSKFFGRDEAKVTLDKIAGL